MATPAHRHRLQYDRAAAARRIQIALMLERLEQLQRCPARNAEQFELKRLAIAELVGNAVADHVPADHAF